MLTLPPAQPQRRRDAAPAPKQKKSAGWSKLANSLVDQALANLSGSAVKVYLVLLRHADRKGISWPSVGRISRVAGMSIRTASTALNELEHNHLINRRRGGSGYANRYQLKTDQIGNPPPITTTPNCRPSASPLPITPATACRPTRPMYSDPDKNRILLRRDRRNGDPTIQAKLASLSDDQFAELKRQVLAKLPPFTATKLAGSDARSSPVLSALIAGELAMQAYSP